MAELAKQPNYPDLPYVLFFERLAESLLISELNRVYFALKLRRTRARLWRTLSYRVDVPILTTINDTDFTVSGHLKIHLRWHRRFLKPINIKKEKSESNAEISSFLLVCVPLGLSKQMKEKKNFKTRTFSTGSYGRSTIQCVHFPYMDCKSIISLKIKLKIKL